MKKIILTSVVLFLISITGFSQTLNKKTLCKKWYLEKYEVMWIDYEPEEKEKNDYILLKSDMTYQSVDEGKFSKGKWSFNDKDKTITLFNNKGEEIDFEVKELNSNKLVVVMKLKEMEDVDIHFITKK
jgi:hypothetical protein